MKGRDFFYEFYIFKTCLKPFNMSTGCYIVDKYSFLGTTEIFRSNSMESIVAFDNSVVCERNNFYASS